MAFADLADTLTLQPGGDAALEITGPFAAACGPVADNLVLKAVRRAARARRRPDGRAFLAREEYSGRGRPRRRLGRCGGGVAAARARQRSCARRSAPCGGGACRRRRRAGLPRLRSRASCAASARSSRPRSICRRWRRCWSIRAWPWRRATCSPGSPALQGSKTSLAGVPRERDALIECLGGHGNDLTQARDRLRARHRRRAGSACAPCRAPGSRACRGRGRPALRCSRRPARPPRRRNGSRPSARTGGFIPRRSVSEQPPLKMPALRGTVVSLAICE